MAKKRDGSRVAYWAEQIAVWRDSGLSQREFCRRRGISIHSLHWWLYQPEAKHAIGQWQRRQRADSQLRKTSAKRPKPRHGTSGALATFLPVEVVANPLGLDDMADTGGPVGGATSVPLAVLLGNGRVIAVSPGFDPKTLRELVAVLEAR